MRKFFALTLLIFSIVIFCNSQPQNVAQSLSLPTSLGNEVSRSVITDGSLYDALISEYNKIYANTPGFEPVNKVYSEMFSQVTELNLENKLIYNLNGLSSLNLEKLTHLNLSKNRISEISFQLLSAQNLTHINLFDNNLSKVNLSYLTKLQEVNLNNNKLTEVNLSQIKTGKILLNNNLIYSQNNITLHNKPQDLVVELINNNLKEIKNLNGVTFEVGLVGLNNTQTEYESGLKLKYYAFTNYDVKLNIYNQNNQVVTTLTQNQEVVLPMGTYYTKYVNQQDQEIYDGTHPIYSAFKNSQTFSIIPQKPLILYVVNGKTYENYYGTFPKNTIILLNSFDQQAKLYYKINDNDWQEGNEIVLKEGGRYNIEIKSVVGEFESKTYTLNILVNTSKFSFFVAWLLAFLAITIGIIVYAIIKNKNIFKLKTN